MVSVGLGVEASEFSKLISCRSEHLPLVGVQAAPEVPVEAVVAQGAADAKNDAEDDPVQPHGRLRLAGRRGWRGLESSVQ